MILHDKNGDPLPGQYAITCHHVVSREEEAIQLGRGKKVTVKLSVPALGNFAATRIKEQALIKALEEKIRYTNREMRSRAEFMLKEHEVAFRNKNKGRAHNEESTS